MNVMWKPRKRNEIRTWQLLTIGFLYNGHQDLWFLYYYICLNKRVYRMTISEEPITTDELPFKLHNEYTRIFIKHESY